MPESQIVGIDLARHLLRTFRHIGTDGNNLRAATLVLGKQGSEFTKILQADRAMKTAVKDDQREVLRRIIGKIELAMAKSGNTKFWNGLSRQEHFLYWRLV